MNPYNGNDDSVRTLIVGYFNSRIVGRHSPSDDLANYLRSSGWPVLEASPIRNPSLRVAHMLYMAWVQRNDYSVAQVSVYSGRPFIWALLTCHLLRLARRSYILTLHGGGLPKFAKRFPRVVNQLLTSASFVTAPSKYLNLEMAPYRKEIVTIPNVLYIEQYRHRTISNCRPKLIWVRSLHSIYNPHLALEVVSILRPDFPQIQLTMIGSERERGVLKGLQRVVTELDLNDCVRFVPGIKHDEVVHWLSDHDVFLNTTNVDNAPVSVMEAMAMGLCVVSTDAGGVSHMLKAGFDSLLTPCGDAARMAEATKRVLCEPALAQMLSYNARRTAEEFDWSIEGPKWKAILRDALLKAERA